MVMGTSPTAFSVSWDPLPAQAQNGIITGYEVHLSYPGGEELILNTTETQAAFTSLLASTVYSVRVAARTEAGKGPLSEATMFATSVIST